MESSSQVIFMFPPLLLCIRTGKELARLRCRLCSSVRQQLVTRLVYFPQLDTPLGVLIERIPSRYYASPGDYVSRSDFNLQFSS